MAVEFARLGAVFRYPAEWDTLGAAIYFEALADIPIDLLRAAVGQWIAKEPDWFPRPGQLRALIAEDLAARRRSYQRLIEDHHDQEAHRRETERDQAIAEKRRREHEDMAREYGFPDFDALAEYGIARAILERTGAPARNGEREAAALPPDAHEEVRRGRRERAAAMEAELADFRTRMAALAESTTHEEI